VVVYAVLERSIVVRRGFVAAGRGGCACIRYVITSIHHIIDNQHVQVELSRKEAAKERPFPTSRAGGQMIDAGCEMQSQPISGWLEVTMTFP